MNEPISVENRPVGPWKIASHVRDHSGFCVVVPNGTTPKRRSRGRSWHYRSGAYRESDRGGEILCLRIFLHKMNLSFKSRALSGFFSGETSHNPLVPGSSPGGPTNSEKPLSVMAGVFFEYYFMRRLTHRGLVVSPVALFSCPN